MIPCNTSSLMLQRSVLEWPHPWVLFFFVLARLEREARKPAREASHETLIRRVAFDLTGMPPTLKEVDTFLNDKSPKAYERMVDLPGPRASHDITITHGL